MRFLNPKLLQLKVGSKHEDVWRECTAELLGARGEGEESVGEMRAAQGLKAPVRGGGRAHRVNDLSKNVIHVNFDVHNLRWNKTLREQFAVGSLLGSLIV